MNLNVQRINYPSDDRCWPIDDFAAGFSAPCAHLKIVEPLSAPKEHQNKYTNCPIPIDRQIALLVKLDDGWYDESSRKYEPIHLRWLTSLLTAVVNAHSLPTPYIYPTPEGLVRAEWSSDSSEVIVSIDLSRRRADVIAFRLASESIEELPVDFTDVDSEGMLGRFIAGYVSETNC
jgi:hypothetical protein